MRFKVIKDLKDLKCTMHEALEAETAEAAPETAPETAPDGAEGAEEGEDDEAAEAR